MLELYMRLFEAKSINFESRGSAHRIGRDEILGAAAHATKRNPLGNRIVLSEMGDQHSLIALSDLIHAQWPEQHDAIFAVLMNRPLPQQLEDLVFKHPRYKREARLAAEIRAKATHLRRCGKESEAKAKDDEAKAVISHAKQRVKEEIMRTGKCPACHGSGFMERKRDMCPICVGSGAVTADTSELKKKMAPETYHSFTQALDAMLVSRSSWVDDFMRQIAREKCACVLLHDWTQEPDFKSIITKIKAML